MTMLTGLLFSTAVLFIASLGALISDLSGRMNIGLEGAMLFGAFFAVLSYRILPWYPVALLVGSLIGLACGYLTAVLAVNGRGNVFIVGLGINLLASGLIPLFSQMFLGVKGVISLESGPATSFALEAIAPVVALLLGVYIMLYLKHHSDGLRLSKIYLSEETALQQGTDVDRFRRAALSWSSALAGLAGGMIAMHLGSYVPNLSAGKGWIALVILYLGNRRLPVMAIAALFFALFQIAANEAQRFISAPGILTGLPFLVTLLALIIYRTLKPAE